MKEQAIREQVKDIMAAIFSIEPGDIGPDSSLDTIERWDSLQHVNLMMALEQEFGIRIEVEDAVEMTSFPAVCETIARYIGEGQ
jgi:acyl carrier protein